MTIERKHYRFGSFSWFLLIIALIGVYFIFFDNQKVFFITASIAVVIAVSLWFLARRGLASRNKILFNKLDNYHEDIQERYKSEQRILHLKDRDNQVRFCETCGHKLDKDSTYCPNCGSEL